MNNSHDIVCRNIFLLRKAAKMTQEELAKKSGLSTTYISRLERGVCDPTLETVYKIADSLAVPVTVFFDPECGVQSNTFIRTKFELLLSEIKSLDVEEQKLIASLTRTFLGATDQKQDPSE